MQIILPDILQTWAYARLLNPHYDGAKLESSLWIHPLVAKLFDQKGQKAFQNDYTSLLASLMYSHQGKVPSRRCDMMNLFFVYDEYTDVVSPEIAHRLSKIVVDAMKNSDEMSPCGEHPIGDKAKEFWRLATTLLPATGSNSDVCKSRFINLTEEYLNAVTVEARDRNEGTIHSVKEYLTMRRATSGAGLMLALIEFELDLPKAVLEHKFVQALEEIYTRTRVSSGQANHNLITVVMHENPGLSLQGAFDWLGSYAAGVVECFQTNVRNLPSFCDVEGPACESVDGTLQERVDKYISGLGQAVRAEDDWAFETTRYYGEDGPKVRETRVLVIRPVKRITRRHLLQSLEIKYSMVRG
ncbi:unnamed protein product [Cyclocybe aegerita]|uniref:Sesquiterpene synthase-like protein Agr11 n=2 Tax=Cyclocybe aegerita TaxID=1973307 RepID=AGR11_CYCAE|nr:RecName: Full=Sesquiterpene synthase-like protein Agr11 [Cyclocybe aegerita]QGA30887.1 putative terpenoid synthase Agr11 [Cyclocybe aegerita]CAA7262784.1 unnamed protein product [Cyclocybe aegerita]